MVVTGATHDAASPTLPPLAMSVTPIERARARAAARRRARPRTPAPAAPGLRNEQIAVVMLLVAETMFFAGLIGAFILFRFGSVVWPPPDLPALPLAVTWANTTVLLASAGTMWWALNAARAGNAAGLTKWVTVTLLLGALFLAVQGAEWARLIGHGLTLSSGMYGATFYTLIGAHALHVVAAILWLAFIWNRCRAGRYTAAEHVGVQVCATYWFFVCALWVVLFGLVYQ